jgi:endonuclease YncB( thermonuclease family)
MQLFLRTLVAAAVLLSVFAGPAAAQLRGQTVGPCGANAGSETCDLWRGKVTFIGDGDTLSVDVRGDGTKKPVRVRVTGIDTMEQWYYTNNPDERTGECHANEATERLEHLVRRAKGQVLLAAQNPDSTSRGRWKRAVSVRINGVWRDLGRIMLNEGHAVWVAGGGEWAWNYKYSVLAQRAKALGRGIWNPDFCSPGPFDSSKIKVWANPDPEQRSRSEVDGEWIRIKNLDPVNFLPVGGWWVRDSGYRRYVLPSWTLIGPGGTLTVHVGHGANTATDVYWGLDKPIFDNARRERAKGDGAYLYDYEGDLRASMLYPCRYECSDPNQGALEIGARPKRRDEYLTVRNVGPAPIDLEGYRVFTRPYSYAFGADSVINPGEELRLNVKGDPAADTRLEKNWGRERTILRNQGDKAEVSTFTNVQLACTAWGSAYC